MAAPPQDIEARFRAKFAVGAPDECWEWQEKGRLRWGYGAFYLNGKTVRAHRVAFLLAHGHWPDPCALHDCDNPPCVNPAHLYEGTMAENMADRDRRGRHVASFGDSNGSRTHPERLPRGERHPAAKLTRSAADEIRSLALAGWLQRDIADAYGVTFSLVSQIKRGVVWREAVAS